MSPFGRVNNRHMDDIRREENDRTDLEIIKKLGELNKSDDNVFAEDENLAKVNEIKGIKHLKYKSVSSIFGDNLIKRSPDKMIDLLQGYIMLATQDQIMYFNVNPYGVEDESKAKPGPDENLIEVNISGKEITYLDLHQNYKIICIQEIGNDLSALVLEDLKTRQIRFLRAFYTELKEEGKGLKRKFKLVQLGVMPNHTSMSVSPLVKYRSVAKEDPVTG